MIEEGAGATGRQDSARHGRQREGLRIPSAISGLATAVFIGLAIAGTPEWADSAAIGFGFVTVMWLLASVRSDDGYAEERRRRPVPGAFDESPRSIGLGKVRA